MPPIRVLLAEDETILREVLADALAEQADLAVVGTAATGDETVRLAEELRPDVLVLDVGLPGMTGVAVAAVLRNAMPELPILVLTARQEPDLLATLVRLGVRGYLTKWTRPAELVRAIRLVDAGGVAFQAGIAQRLAERVGLGPRAEPTAREAEVLRLVAAGLRNREVAARLGVGEATVEFHLRNLFRKFGAGSRTDLVGRARRLGWSA